MDRDKARPIVRQWLDLYDDSTPAERQAARGYVLAQRHPRRTRWWLFPRRSAWLPIIIGRENVIIGGEPPAAPGPWPTRTWLRQFAGLAAFCCLALIGLSAIHWGPALSRAWLDAALPLAHSAPAAAGVLTVWSALVAFPLGLSVLGTHAALRQMTLVL